MNTNLLTNRLLRYAAITSATTALWVLPALNCFAQSRNDVLAQSGQAAPDFNGNFSTFGIPVQNSSGQVVFIANLSGTSGGSTNDSGIFGSSGGIVSQIVREGQSVPR